ncbi:5-dehydro-4-deoxyglucarate dehydratase [Pollutimonas subterranea]|uniref:Probable 5-dehydro-4-deoxyglucarate dehydratase n=1 Tax=Pollutimonas subterranea TaxID=2045210 RepID=A0A2N4U671_9BURK|nr:5-dehydro-4-deoxyglucarate dehydratase [Pollutimonas subterranea]
MDAQELKQVIGAGLLSFPLTDFDEQHDFNKSSYRKRLEWLKSYDASALFAAGGTGEFFSLAKDEYADIIGTAVDECRGQMPIIAGTGYGTRVAIEYAVEAERQGADGILILPHYLTEADQEGLRRHVVAICKSVSIGVIVYNRGLCRLNAETVEKIADECPNLVGFKDGFGDIELMMSIRSRLGDRLAYIGGLPTAEVFASACKAMGVSTYSSAVFNFIPRTAVEFYNASVNNDSATMDHLLKTFFFPYLELRNSGQGYAVSIVKAGATVVGKTAGPVRTPLCDLSPAQHEQLRTLIDRLGPQ